MEATGVREYTDEADTADVELTVEQEDGLEESKGVGVEKFPPVVAVGEGREVKVSPGLSVAGRVAPGVQVTEGEGVGVG